MDAELPQFALTQAGTAGTGPGPPGRRRGIWACTGLTVITQGISSWVCRAQEEIRGRGGGWLGLVVHPVIIPVTLLVVPAEVNQMYLRDGELPPVSAWTGPWHLISLARAISWFVKVDGALNRFGARAARRPEPPGRTYLPRRRQRGDTLSPPRRIPTAPKNAATPPPIIAMVSTR
jgi:hypothetical protein